jgi:Rieske 2Fe-2S family protein
MPRFPKPPEGSWTEHFELGTKPQSYEDSISPEFYELERKAIFKPAWLNIGRVEQLPRPGSYFTKELEVAKTIGPKNSRSDCSGSAAKRHS